MSEKKPPVVHPRISEDVQEILSKPPNSLIRWGSSSMLAILGLLLLLGSLVKYPETINGEAKLTTSIEPSLIYNLSEGYLEKVVISEDSVVQKGQVLGEIRNTVLSDNITFLEQTISYLRDLIKKNASSIELSQTELSFGSLQESYNNLLKLVYEYNELNNRYHYESTQRLSNKITSLKSLSAVLSEKLEIGEKELQNAKIQFQMDEKLYKEEVIAKSEWIEKTSRYHQKINELQNLKQSVLQNNIEIKETDRLLADLMYDNTNARRKNINEIELVITSIENQKKEWKQKYTLIAPISGKINFIKKISSGEFLKINQPIGFIVPENNDIKAKVKIPYKGFGKIRLGQKARVTLDSYPYQEFGYLTGEVIKIAEAPSDDNFYEVIIELPDVLISSFKHKLIYKPNSAGIAEIITQDYSIFERLIFSSRNAFNFSKHHEK